VICKNRAANQIVEVKLAENYEGLPPEIERLSERLAKDPKSLVFSSLANAYRKNSMVDEAIEILQKGLEIHPNYASARIVLGKCYVDKRMYELAKEQFKKALENDPQNVVVLESLARVYKTLNQYNDAFEIFKRLLDLDPLNENFEREVEELKGLVKDISGSSEQYASFQTIPSQAAVEQKSEEEKPAPEPEPKSQPEPESDAPTLSDIFEGVPASPDSPPSDEATSQETEQSLEKPNIVTTATDFSDMFEKEEPETTPPEKTQSAGTEQPSREFEKPADHGTQETTQPQPSEPSQFNQSPPAADAVIEHEKFELFPDEAAPEPAPEPEIPEHDTTTAEIPSETASSSEEASRIEGITSAFDEAGLEGVPERGDEGTQESLAPNTEAIVSELSQELSMEEHPEPPQEAATVEQPPVEEDQPPPVETSPEAAAATPKPDQKPRATETLAEIYLSQGFNSQALHIYRELLARDPENDSLKQKITKLEQRIAMESGSQQEQEKTAQDDTQEPSEQERRTQSKNLDSFQDWLKKFQK
jgi:tetratricopeptide (TPR) repeat protein